MANASMAFSHGVYTRQRFDFEYFNSIIEVVVTHARFALELSTRGAPDIHT